MFDFAWSEIALIGVVALIAIGPKDLPVAIKAVADMIKKARRMAGEFQTHVDEMVREANLGEVREQFNDLRRMDIKGQILKAVDEDGTIRKTLSEPIDFAPPPPAVPVHDTAPALAEPTPVPELAAYDIPAPPPSICEPPAAPVAPAFVPPSYAAPRPQAPAFVPPSVAAAARV